MSEKFLWTPDEWDDFVAEAARDEHRAAAEVEPDGEEGGES